MIPQTAHHKDKTPMKTRLLIAAALAALALPNAAQAHRQWMLPSSTILSGSDAWVTFDAAISNELFYFDHNPMRTDGVTVTAPDGSTAMIENPAKGRFRSTFDVHLTKPGTWRIANVSTGVMGSYRLNGKQERLPRGTTKEKLASVIPAGATDVQTSELISRNEVFVTLGAPSQELFKPTGEGIELVPVTHPNDLVAGEQARFQFLLDGKPAANMKVTIIPGGIRYRNGLNQMDMVTDADGALTVNWPEAGMYWLNAVVGGGAPDGPAMGAAPEAGADPSAGAIPRRRASYVTTLEVQAP